MIYTPVLAAATLCPGDICGEAYLPCVDVFNIRHAQALLLAARRQSPEQQTYSVHQCQGGDGRHTT
jgi:hypothetical protein